MLGRTIRISVLLGASCSLVTVLAACGGKGGTVESQPQLHSQRSPSTVGPCPDFVLCIRGDHWDSLQCRCVPDEDDAGTAADAPDEAAVDAGSVTPDGGDDADDGGSATSCSGN